MALNVVAKAFSIVEGALNIAVVVADEERTQADVINALFQGIFLVGQGADIGVQNSKLTPNQKLISASGAAALDLARFVTETIAKYKKSQKPWTNGDTIVVLLQLGAKVFFRWEDIAVVAKEIDGSPEFLQLLNKHITFAHEGSNFANVASTAYRVHISKSKIERVYARLKSKWRGGGPRRQEPARIIQRLTPEELIEQELKQKEEFQDLIRYKGDISQLLTIPDCISVGWRNFCCITGKPIRFAVLPDVPLGRHLSTSEGLLIAKAKYEKETLENWIREKPNEAPPGWPVQFVPLPLSEQSFKVDVARQADIDQLIEDRIQEACEALDAAGAIEIVEEESKEEERKE